MFSNQLAWSVAAASVAVATAGFASANTVDEAFISRIDGYPVPYSTTDNAIKLGHTVCDQLAAGRTVESVVVEIGGPANWTIAQSQFFADAAVASYCPGGTPAAAPIAAAPPPVVQAPLPIYAPAPSALYFSNCSAARSAGAAPLYAGQPGYRSALDRDGDGVACE